MWELPPGVRWDLSRSHDGRYQVNVLSRGELVSEGAEIIDGLVTESWVTGLRSKISLSVNPSSLWLEWLKLPKLELQVWSGISWGRSSLLVPMGVFMMENPGEELPAASISLSGSDRWKTIAQNDFLNPWPAEAGWASERAGHLMRQGGLPDVSIDVDRDVKCPVIIWEGKRHDVIRDYLSPIGADAGIDRDGSAWIKTRTTSPGRALSHGTDGTLVKISSSVSLEEVYNAVGAISSNSSAIVDPAFASITDPDHPAHEDKIGKRQTTVSSQMIANWNDAFNFAHDQLAKLSAPALGWSAECVPDPTRMPGDLIPVTSKLGSINAAVQQVTHPLVVDSDSKTQKITFGAIL